METTIITAIICLTIRAVAKSVATIALSARGKEKDLTEKNQMLQRELIEKNKVLNEIRDNRRVQLLCALPGGPHGLLGGQEAGTIIHVQLKAPPKEEFYLGGK